ncbi:ras and Rab interactor-like protein [Pogona vitticeps]
MFPVRQDMDEITGGASRSLEEKEPRTQPVTNGKSETPLPLLDRLSLTRRIWELLDGQPAQAEELLSAQGPGAFIVTRNRPAGVKTLILQIQEAVCHFPIKEESSAVYLEGSLLRFRDLLELVGFYLVSRDILPCPLRIPDGLRLPSKPELDAVAALGMKFWTMPLKSGSGPSSAKADDRPPGPHRDPPESSQPACSIQVTSEEGALCIINPLFLSVHSDSSWLDLATSQGRLSRRRRRRTQQGSNGWIEAASKKQGSSLEGLDHPGPLEEEKEVGKHDPPSSSSSTWPKRLDCPLSMRSSEAVSEDSLLTSECPQKEIRTPHRVSWIEGIPAGTPPAGVLEKSYSELSLLSETLLPPPLLELDSLSLSSAEDDADSPLLTPATPQARQRRSSALLTYKVLHRLSAVSSTLGSFLSAERRISRRVQELAQDPTSYVGGLVQSFVGHILRGAGARHPTSTDMLQEIRQMISNLKGYLCESSELHAICEHSEGEEMDLGSVVEGALYKCLLKPLRDAIYAQLLDFRSRDGTLSRLREHQRTMTQQSLAQLGVAAGVPDSAGLERIQTKLSLMHQAYSPKKKETQMLKVCKMLYEAMNQTAGRTEAFGADDFLPVLIYTLVNSDIASVQLDVEYMMELMDPSQLQGEGGYYLTTWFGALYHIANFQPAAMVTRQISIEAQHSIHQWHRRRTIHHHHHHQAKRTPSQNTLYVSLHEPFSNQKTVAVSEDTTAASVCAACAEKYGVSDREAYGLFLVSGESSQLLAEGSYPQRLHLESLQSKGAPVNFVFKLKGGALPTDTPLSRQNPNGLTGSQEPLEEAGRGQSEVDGI